MKQVTIILLFGNTQSLADKSPLNWLLQKIGHWYNPLPNWCPHMQNNLIHDAHRRLLRCYTDGGGQSFIYNAVIVVEIASLL